MTLLWKIESSSTDSCLDLLNLQCISPIMATTLDDDCAYLRMHKTCLQRCGFFMNVAIKTMSNPAMGRPSHLRYSQRLRVNWSNKKIGMNMACTNWAKVERYIPCPQDIGCFGLAFWMIERSHKSASTPFSVNFLKSLVFFPLKNF